MSEIIDFKIIGGKITVDQAAWMAKKSNQAIYNATKDGRITAELQDRNGKSVKVIQLLDLERLYQDLRYPNDPTEVQKTREPSQAINKSNNSEDNINAERLLEMMEKRFKEQISQYEEEVEYLRKAHEKSQETAQRITLMLEDKSKQSDKGDDWNKSMKAMEARISNQEKAEKDRKDREQKILRQNQALKKALDAEKNKSIWQKLFG